MGSFKAYSNTIVRYIVGEKFFIRSHCTMNPESQYPYAFASQMYTMYTLVIVNMQNNEKYLKLFYKKSFGLPAIVSVLLFFMKLFHFWSNKIFEITRTIYSNIERSEQLLVTKCFFNLFLEVSHIY